MDGIDNEHISGWAICHEECRAGDRCLPTDRLAEALFIYARGAVGLMVIAWNRSCGCDSCEGEQCEKLHDDYETGSV